jgi:4-hydroxybenzoate polyprenyltransferase
LNDVFDLEVDRINAPHRPLTSGLLSPAEAVGLTAAAIVLGLASAYAIGIPALILYAISCSFALTLSAAHFGLAILVGFVPFLMGWMQPAYLVMLSIMDALIVVFTIRLLKSDTPKDGRRAMRGMYLGALIGMLAFILSQMFQM